MTTSVTSGTTAPFSSIAVLCVSTASGIRTADAFNTFFLCLDYVSHGCSYAYHNYKTCNKVCHFATPILSMLHLHYS